MKRVISTGPMLIAGLMLLLVSSTLVAKNLPASYVKQGVDLSVYNKVMVKPLNMDNIEVLKPAWEQDNDDVWSFEPENVKAIQEWFMDAMQKELEVKGGYAMVSQPASDVMRIEIEMLSITPYVKPGTPANDGNFKTSTLGSGDVVISAEFRDSKTRELLILVEGERAIGTEYKKLSPQNHVENIKGLFARWGMKVREALDQAHGK